MKNFIKNPGFGDDELEESARDFVYKEDNGGKCWLARVYLPSFTTCGAGGNACSYGWAGGEEVNLDRPSCCALHCRELSFRDILLRL